MYIVQTYSLPFSVTFHRVLFQIGILIKIVQNVHVAFSVNLSIKFVKLQCEEFHHLIIVQNKNRLKVMLQHTSSVVQATSKWSKYSILISAEWNILTLSR